MNERSDATGAWSVNLEWSRATIDRLAHEKCSLRDTCSVPEVRAQQTTEIDAEADYHIKRFIVSPRAGGEQ